MFIDWPLFFGSRCTGYLRKKGRTELRPASHLITLTPQKLECELQAQLDRAWSAGTDGRIGGRDIGRRATTAERCCRWIIQAKSILTAVRVRKVGVIENVEELDAALKSH